MLGLFLTISLALADWGPFPAYVESSLLEEDTGFTSNYPPCNSKKLLDGVQLPKNTELYKRWHPENAWGSPRMIDVLIQAAEDVRWNFPEADPLVIGDISKESGGNLEGHKSHKGGSDADIGIYFGKSRQHMIGFMNVSAQQFDAETNWVLIRSLLESNEVERILVDQSLVDELRKYVIQAGEMTKEEANRTFPAKMTNEIWLREKVVHHHKGHKHHYHVRTFCPP